MVYGENLRNDLDNSKIVGYLAPLLGIVNSSNYLGKEDGSIWLRLRICQTHATNFTAKNPIFCSKNTTCKILILKLMSKELIYRRAYTVKILWSAPSFKFFLPPNCWNLKIFDTKNSSKPSKITLLKY